MTTSTERPAAESTDEATTPGAPEDLHQDATEDPTENPMPGQRVPPSKCPHCGKRLDMASAIDAPATPEPGDYSVCIDCGGFLRFGPNLGLVAPTPEEIRALPLLQRRQLQLVQSQTRLFIKRRAGM